MALLDDADIDERLAGGSWRRDGGEIVRDLDFPDFAAAIAFVNKVADSAESANHHPDILLHSYNKVRLTLSTHSAGGITDSDLAMAATFDGIA
jgi:4a-hydroxytetrahydrobiopterin dehydratase